VPLPDTFVELLEAHYVHSGSGWCGRCHAKLEWFLTPKNHWMPFSLKRDVLVGQDSIIEVKSQRRYEPHFAICGRK
jgi:hypothetical protein